MLKYSLPLIPNALSWWAISAADRFIILYYLGLSSNGLFAIAVKFPSILVMVHTIFNMAWQERAIRTYETADRDQYYTSILNKYVGFVFGLIVVAIAVTKPGLKFMVQKSYYDVWKIVPCMYLAVGFQALSSFFGTGYNSSKDTKGALTTTIFGVCASIAINMAFIPVIGLLSPSIAFLAGFLVMFVARAYQTRKYFTVTIPYKKMLVLVAFSIVVAVITLSENNIVLFANVALSIVVFLVFNKDMILQMWGKLMAMKAKVVSA
jgi:O-antigen/teichoic acid export membrane protein